jgi:hypothetical protein
MEEFSSNFTQMFTPTGQCAELVLPLCQLKAARLQMSKKYFDKIKPVKNVLRF